MYQGFTLIELLTTLLIASLLLLVGVPGATALLEQQRSRANVQQVLSAVAFARNSAITLNATVSLCPALQPGVNAAIGGGPAPQCGPRNTWHNGTLIFKDGNANGTIDGTDSLLRQQAGWQHGGRISWRAFRNRGYLQFNRRGFTNWQNGSFIYCPAGGQLRWARRIVLNTAGRTYRAYSATRGGIDKGPGGRPLAC